MNASTQRLKYIFFDWFSAATAWGSLFVFRKVYIESNKFGYEIPVVADANLIMGILIIPFYWLVLYTLTGMYKEPLYRSRLREFVYVLNLSFLGVLFLFFLLLLDDEVKSYKDYYYTFILLFGIHFGLSAFFRMLVSTQTKRAIQSRKIGFNTILVGCNAKSEALFYELEGEKKSQGFLFKGYINVTNQDSLKGFDGKLPCLGSIKDLRSVVRDYDIREVILAIETSQHESLKQLLEELEGIAVNMRIIPDMFDIISGSVKINHIMGPALMEVKRDLLPSWQETIKRGMDILVSLVALIIGLPMYLFLASMVKFSSKGPVFYMQERIGLNGKPFKIIKFRSMRVDAEKNGPQLAKENDSRVTAFGAFMRKTRLDELPQFVNVLSGDMALVGPRPERQYFIDQIIEKAPQYKLIQRVRPGITSWGQVKYGYAENVDEMIERLKFDLLYIENMSLAIDFKIIFYTVIIMLQGRGK